jgi:hypothetical protein
MISSEALAYCERGIARYLSGDINEFLKLTNKAMEIHKETPNLINCRYKVNGQWIKSRICFETGCIYDLQGKLLRRGHAYKCGSQLQ